MVCARISSTGCSLASSSESRLRLARVIGCELSMFFSRAMVGHTGPKYIYDDTLSCAFNEDDIDVGSCIAHSTKSHHVESIACRGLLPGEAALLMLCLHSLDNTESLESTIQRLVVVPEALHLHSMRHHRCRPWPSSPRLLLHSQSY